MHKNFLIALWKFTRDGKKTEKALFKSLKVSKTFKVKSLTTSKLDVPPKKIAYNLFYEVMWEKKKELKITTVSQPSAIILKECKNVEVNDQDMKKYTDFTRQKNNNMKTIWRDTKKIIWQGGDYQLEQKVKKRLAQRQM